MQNRIKKEKEIASLENESLSEIQNVDKVIIQLKSQQNLDDDSDQLKKHEERSEVLIAQLERRREALEKELKDLQNLEMERKKIKAKNNEIIAKYDADNGAFEKELNSKIPSLFGRIKKVREDINNRIEILNNKKSLLEVGKSQGKPIVIDRETRVKSNKIVSGAQDTFQSLQISGKEDVKISAGKKPLKDNLNRNPSICSDSNSACTTDCNLKASPLAGPINNDENNSLNNTNQHDVDTSNEKTFLERITLKLILFILAVLTLLYLFIFRNGLYKEISKQLCRILSMKPINQ